MEDQWKEGRGLLLGNLAIWYQAVMTNAWMARRSQLQRIHFVCVEELTLSENF